MIFLKNYKKLLMALVLTTSLASCLQAYWLEPVIKPFIDNKYATIMTCSTVTLSAVCYYLWKTKNSLQKENNTLNGRTSDMNCTILNYEHNLYEQQDKENKRLNGELEEVRAKLNFAYDRYRFLEHNYMKSVTGFNELSKSYKDLANKFNDEEHKQICVKADAAHKESIHYIDHFHYTTQDLIDYIPTINNDNKRAGLYYAP